MDFGDVAARMKQARKKTGEEESGEDRPFDYEESYRLRGKMLGVLIQDARLDARRSTEDCAQVLGIPPQEFASWEYGDSIPNLPQLEILAHYFGVPVSRFWSQDTLESERSQEVDAQKEYKKLRHRMIGALLRQAREEAEISVEQLSQDTYISADVINSYELGEPIPLNELTTLSSGVKKNLSYFLENSSHIGELLAIRETWKHFSELPDELREFAANPTNIGFIEVAYMLSRMPTDKLRKIGESMLGITM